MPGDGGDRRLASALFRARLIDEPTLRAALADCAPGALGERLVAAGCVRREDVKRAAESLSASSGAFAALEQSASAVTLITPAPGVAATVSSPPSGPSAPPRGSGSTLDALLAAKPGAPLPAGSTLGPYRLERLIAKGGMGAVFVASHEQLGRTVALKVLLAGEGATAEQVERFLAEAKAASRVAHPNVVPIYDVGEAQGIRYLTMELVQGPSLRKVIKDGGPLEPRRALALVEQVARGVAAAHASGIIHRDLKPENVLVAPGDVAKVMDFGLAKETDTERGLTASGAVLGTPQYMAPEQAAGEKVGPLADVWGVGAILYESLTGKPPFDGPTIANILTRIFNDDVVPPRRHRPSLNKDVETICLAALEKTPAKRYPGVAALADDAARWLKGDAILARPASARERLARWARRRRGAVVAGALGGAVSVGTLLWFTVVAGELARTARRQATATFDAIVEREVARVGSDAAALEAAVESVAAARATLRTAWTAAPAADRPAAIGSRTAEARIYSAAGDDLRSKDPRLGERRWARAYAEEPLSAAGLEALAKLIDTREGAAAFEKVDHILASGVPKDTAARLRLSRAKLFLEELDLPRAAGELEAVLAEPSASADVRERAQELLDFVGPIAPYRDVPWPLAAQFASVVKEPGAARASVHVHDRRGASVVLRFDGDRILQEKLDAPVTASGPLLAGDDVLEGVALTVRPNGRYGAYFIRNGAGYRVAFARDGRVLGAVARNSALHSLRFVELDGDPATIELFCNIRPNDGDSFLLRIDDSRATGVPLDREFKPVMSGATYATSFAPATVDGRPSLLVGFGPWQGYRFRALAWEGGRLATLAESPRIGRVAAIGAIDRLGRGAASIVAATDCHEVTPDWVPEARSEIALYDLEGGALRKDPRTLDLLSPRHGSQNDQLVELTLLRRKGGAFALISAGDITREGRLRRRFARLSGTPAIVADVLLRSSGAIGAGDLDGDGEDDLVVHGQGCIRLLGVRGGLRLEAAPVAVSGDPVVPADLLRRLDEFPREALRAVERRQEALGITPDTENVELDILQGELSGGGESFEETSAAALRKRGTSRTFQAHVHALRASHFSESDSTLERARAELERSYALVPHPGDADGERLDAVRRILAVRSPDTARLWRHAPTTVEAVFRREGGELPARSVADRLLASDPTRFRFDAERGLVVSADRRVRLLAGIPVVLPRGTTRLTLELESGHRAWGTKIVAGLFREVGVGITPEPRRLEGLTVTMHCWQVSTHPADDSRVVLAGIGSPGATGPFGGRLGRGRVSPPPFLKAAHQFHVRWRITLEHDAPTRWSRFVIDDLVTNERLVEDQGPAARELSSGPFLLGICSLGENGRDTAGGGHFAPDTEVSLARIRVDHVSTETAIPEAVQLLDAPVGPAEARRVVYGRLVLPEPRGQERLDDLAQRESGEERARLLFHAAFVRSRAKDAAGARERFAAALAAHPLGFFRAVEDDGAFLDAATAATLRETIAAELRAALAAGDAGLARRAVLHRLRGEVLECLQCCDGPLDEEARAYLRASAANTPAHAQALARLPARPSLPEVTYPLRPFWAPLEPGADAEGAIRSGLERALAAEADRRDHGADMWLDRWIELAPERADLLLRRALRAREHPDGARRSALAWRYERDLERVLALDPQNADASLYLGFHQLSWRNYPSMTRLLRVARQGGHGDLVRRELERLVKDGKAPSDLARAVAEVLDR